MEYTLKYCREHELDVYFLPSLEEAKGYAHKMERETGRPTITFTEPVHCGTLHFELHCCAITRRPRPVITTIT